MLPAAAAAVVVADVAGFELAPFPRGLALALALGMFGTGSHPRAGAARPVRLNGKSGVTSVA